MKSSKLKNLIFLVSSFLAGYLVTIGSATGFILGALSLILLMVLCDTRFFSWIVASIYYLVAIRDLPIGISNYYSSVQILPIIIWISLALILSTPWILLWSKNIKYRIMLVPLVLVILAIPPFGIFGILNPISTLGFIMPGSGFLGIGFFLSFFWLVILIPKHINILGAVTIIMFCVSSKNESFYSSWRPVNTEYKYDNNLPDFQKNYFRTLEIIEKSENSKDKYLVFPEGILGDFNRSSKILWAKNNNGLQDKSLLIGADYTNNNGTKDNIVLLADKNNISTVYRQRQPIPFSMWNPFKADSYNINWISNPIFKLKNKKISFLICYESLLVWPVLQSMSHSPDSLIVISNLWWTKNTNIREMFYLTNESWGKLFSKNILISTNN